MALVPNGTTTVVNNCKSILFQDITGVYSVGNTTGYGTPNPNYTDIASVTFTLIDGASQTVGVATTGWIPDLGTPLNDSLYLFPSDFGLTTTEFANDTYTLVYTLTMNDNTVYVKTITDIVVNCTNTGVICNTTQYRFRFTETGITFPCTLTNFKAYGITFTNPTPTSLANMTDLISALNALASAQTSVYAKWCVFSEASGIMYMNTPYETGTISDQSITINNGAPVTNIAYGIVARTFATNVAINIDWTCSTSKLTITNTGYNWDGTTFPSYADINGNVYLKLLDSSLNPIGSVTLSNAEFQSFIAGGITLGASNFGVGAILPCTNYYINPQIDLLNGSNLSCLNKLFVVSACGTLKPSDLVVKTSVSFGCDCSKFSFCDTTGTYDSILNPTGYGDASTALYADIYNTTLSITSLATGVSVLIDNGFVPSEIGVNCFDITIDDIMSVTRKTGLTTIPDTVYLCVYNVYDSCDQLLGTSTIYLRFTCNLQNCIDQRGADLVTGCCTNDSGFEKDVLQDMIFNLAMFQNPAIPNNKMDCIARRIENLSQQCVFGCPTCK